MADPDVANQILTLLRHPESLEQIREAHQNAWQTSGGGVAAGASTALDAVLDAARSMAFSDALEIECGRGTLRDIFSRCIVQKLEPPEIIDVEDLAGSFLATMRVPPSCFDVAFASFLGNLDLLVLDANESRPFDVAAADPHEEQAEDGHEDDRSDQTSRRTEWQGLSGTGEGLSPNPDDAVWSVIRKLTGCATCSAITNRGSG